MLGANLGPFDDVCGLEGPHETRPSRPAVELVERCEERLAGNDVDVEARLLVVPVFVGEGELGPVSLRTRYCSGVNFETASGFCCRSAFAELPFVLH